MQNNQCFKSQAIKSIQSMNSRSIELNAQAMTYKQEADILRQQVKNLELQIMSYHDCNNVCCVTDFGLNQLLPPSVGSPEAREPVSLAKRICRVANPPFSKKPCSLHSESNRPSVTLTTMSNLGSSSESGSDSCNVQPLVLGDQRPSTSASAGEHGRKIRPPMTLPTRTRQDLDIPIYKLPLDIPIYKLPVQFIQEREGVSLSQAIKIISEGQSQSLGKSRRFESNRGKLVSQPTKSVDTRWRRCLLHAHISSVCDLACPAPCRLCGDSLFFDWSQHLSTCKKCDYNYPVNQPSISSLAFDEPPRKRFCKRD